MPTDLIAKNLKTYAGRALTPGQRFSVNDADVRTLTLAPGGLAELAPAIDAPAPITEPAAAAQPAAAGDYATRAMSSEASPRAKRH